MPIYLRKNFSKATLNFGMAFSAGVMLVAAFIALLIPSLNMAKDIYGSIWGFVPVLAGLVIGYKLIIYFHSILPHEHLMHGGFNSSPRKLKRIYLIVLAICLHNIPEGLSVGIGFGGELSKGISLGLAIAIQNMPEGLVVALGLISIGMGRNKAFIISLISGMVEPVAAVIGYYTATATELLLPFSFALAGGAMLFVVCQEMFPDLFEDTAEKSTINGMLLGVTCMLSLEYYIVY